MKIFALTLLFVQSGYILTQVLVAARRVRLLIVLTLVSVAAQAAVLGAGALGELTLTWAAWSAVTGQAAFTLLLLAASCRLLGVDWRQALAFWGRIPLGMAALAALLLAIDAVAPDPERLADALALGAAQLAVFVAVAAALVLALDRAVFSESRALLRGGG